MSGIGDDLTAIGEFYSSVSAVVLSIVGLILIIIGIYMIFNQYVQVNGIIVTPNCIQSETGGKYTCDMLVHYVVNNAKYNQTISTHDKQYDIGQQIPLYYPKNDPSAVQINNNQSTILMCLIFGLLLPAIGWTSYYFAHEYRAYAEVLGFSTALSVVKGIF